MYVASAVDWVSGSKHTELIYVLEQLLMYFTLSHKNKVHNVQTKRKTETIE